MRTLWNRFRDWIDRERLTAELEEELQSHRRMLQRDQQPGDRRRFGNATRIVEEARDVWSIAWLDVLGRDLRYAFRTLRRSPAFTTVVVITLALGIGANTAIFSVWQRVLFPDLPYRDPEQLVVVSQRNTASGEIDKVTAGDFAEWKARSRLVEGWG